MNHCPSHPTLRAAGMWLSAAVVVLLPLTLSGCGADARVEAAPNQQVVEAQSQRPERVTAGPPQRKTLQLYTTQPAAVRAYEEASLHARASGYVRKVHVDIGDRVEQGHVLIEIDAAELHDDVARFEALVLQAQARKGQAEAATRAAAATVHTARAKKVGVEAGLDRAKAELERARAEHDRIEDLAGRGSISARLVDEALNQFRAAEASAAEAVAAIQSAEAGVEEAEAILHRFRADEDAAQALLEVANAELRRAVTMASYTEIRAPFAGVITRRKVDAGHSVYAASEASQPLLVIARDDTVRVVVDIPETEAQYVTSGGDHPDPAVVTVQGIAGRSFESQVARTSWSLDPANRSLRVEIDIPNEQRLLRSGMYATARILLEQRDDVLTLPAAALIDENGVRRCCVVVDGKIEYRQVETGLRSGSDVEIISGLSSDDQVVLARAAGLAEGQRVEVIAPAS